MLKISSPALLLLVCAMIGHQTDAFVPQKGGLTSTPRTSSVTMDPLNVFEGNPTEIPYGEESRKYRRTVYSHEDWVKHRSPDRFIKNILSTNKSGIYKNVGREVLVVTLIATFVMLWNMLTGEYTDLVGTTHPGILRGQFTPVLALPMNPFTLSSSFLGLLLVFRTNKAYQRWDEARKNWGMNM